MHSPFLRSMTLVAFAAALLAGAPYAFADVPPPQPVPPTPAKPDEKPAPTPAEKPPEKPIAGPVDAASAKPAEEGVVFESGEPTWADLLAKAKTAGKPIFIDFFTTWCGWCKKLDADTYPKPAVGKVMEGFVNVRVDAEKGEGVDLAKRFAANGFPTLVIVGTDDQEIDRIVGYLAPEPFEKEIRRILSGEDTLPSLRKAVDANPDDLKAALALAKKLLSANASDAEARLDAIAEKAKGKDRGVEAGILVLRASRDMSVGKRDDARALYDRVALEFGDTDAAKDATGMSLRLRSGAKADPEEALAFAAQLRAKATDGKLDGNVEQLIASLHLRAAEKAMERAAADAGDDAQKLNAVAWTCYERRIAIVAAAGWARTAVEKSGRDVQILDTLANLLALQKKFDDAIALELEALGKLTDTDAAMRKDFQRNVAMWVMERDGMKADGAIPATRIQPPKPKNAR